MFKTLLKIVGKLFSFLGGVLLTLIIVTPIFVISHIDPGDDVAVDAVKRLRSPDYQKLAFLVSINGGSERIIDIEVMTSKTTIGTGDYSFYRNKTEQIFRKYFDPDLRVNLHENIEWSSDSSLLLLRVDPSGSSKPFKWAYDFKSKEEVTDPNSIESLWRERNQSNVNNET